MMATVEIAPIHWALFVLAILFFLALDLGIFHRHAHVVSFREAVGWTAVWVTVSMLFAAGLVPLLGQDDAIEFVTGYIIELSLSMDNVFVIALIFSYFKVPEKYQHRVLFWGILGALVMRGLMIGIGAALIARFSWMLYVFGGFLIVTGIKMLFTDEDGVHPERNPVVRLVRRMFPVTANFAGHHFLVRSEGKLMLTPLAVVLVMVETTDLIFAIDSIPAIFIVTQKPFIVFTSNVFAILGLRSLYFVLAGAIAYFRFLKVGLAFVLVFIGGKMLLTFFGVHIPVSFSLGLVGGIIMVSVLFSVMLARNDQPPPTNGSDGLS